ncbi:hypothetical protein JIQ42_06674 [Leishmania sp. Namibia]|uniref:hypothetical protein n=1 Tax=Leishmania sp. Namibia TaxID=2802991 RepID=UPI001B654C9F|nr:hypothetical protein JIQ42_06674 [Leishmania sp. Namibia]
MWSWRSRHMCGGASPRRPSGTARAPLPHPQHTGRRAGPRRIPNRDSQRCCGVAATTTKRRRRACVRSTVSQRTCQRRS